MGIGKIALRIQIVYERFELGVRLLFSFWRVVAVEIVLRTTQYLSHDFPTALLDADLLFVVYLNSDFWPIR